MPTTPSERVSDRRRPGDPAEARIRVLCGQCAMRLRVRAIHVGQIVRCPRCDTPVPVPGNAEGDGSVDASISIDPETTRRHPRRVRHLGWWITADVIFFIYVGWMIGRSVWHY